MKEALLFYFIIKSLPGYIQYCRSLAFVVSCNLEKIVDVFFFQIFKIRKFVFNKVLVDKSYIVIKISWHIHLSNHRLENIF